MTQPVPTYAQETYAVLRNRFGEGEFGPAFLSWFLSPSMARKTLHVLARAGWTRRTGKGRYVCVPPDSIFQAMVQFRVPALLTQGGRPYSYSDASAVEIWTDYSYIQRSWEHSPYYVHILRGDVAFWVAYLRANRVKVFVGEAKNALGEFVVLQARPKLSRREHGGLPVEPLDAVVRYCERNLAAFEYPLAYLKAKFGAHVRVELDPRTVEEAGRAA